MDSQPKPRPRTLRLRHRLLPVLLTQEPEVRNIRANGPTCASESQRDFRIDRSIHLNIPAAEQKGRKLLMMSIEKVTAHDR